MGAVGRAGCWSARAASGEPCSDRSGGSEAEGVEVVGEDRPGGPGARAGVAFQARSVEPVASFEVTDAALGAAAESGKSPVGLARARGRVSADEQSLWFGQMRAPRAGLKPPSSAISRGR